MYYKYIQGCIYIHFSPICLLFFSGILLVSDTTKFNAIITGITILTVQFVITHSYIGTVETIAQLDMTDTAFETIDVIEK